MPAGRRGNMTQPNATNLTPQQERAAEMLAAGRRMGATAKALGVHRVTLWEWTKLPDFQEYLNELRRVAWRSTLDRMRENTAKAARVLGTILSDPATVARDRLAAAKAVLAAAGPLFPGSEPVETRGVPKVNRPPDWMALAFSTAHEAVLMSGGIGILLAQTPGKAWTHAGLESAFPGSFAHLKSLADRPAEAEAFCRDLLAQLRDSIDVEIMGNTKNKDSRAGER